MDDIVAHFLSPWLNVASNLLTIPAVNRLQVLDNKKAMDFTVHGLKDKLIF
jgi:hypothetical protein